MEDMDSLQLISWAAKSVQQQMGSQSSLMQQLQSEVAKLKGEKAEAEKHLVEMRKEVKSRTTTTDILTNNLDHW